MGLRAALFGMLQPILSQFSGNSQEIFKPSCRTHPIFPEVNHRADDIVQLTLPRRQEDYPWTSYTPVSKP
jgi:hypothetical protein